MDLVGDAFRAVLFFVKHGNFDLYSVIISRCLLTMYLLSNCLHSTLHI